MQRYKADGAKIAKAKKIPPWRKHQLAALSRSRAPASLAMPAMPAMPATPAMPRLGMSTSTSKITSNRKGFLDLAAELRNEVYALALPKGEVIGITDGWPSILCAHPQIFDEALAMFLSSNTFSVNITDRRDGAFTGWLDMIKTLSQGQTSCTTSVIITLSGRVLEWDKANGCFDPDFEYWGAFVKRIKEAGLRAEQVAWSCLQFDRASSSLVSQGLIPLHLLHRRIIKPILKHQGLFDPAKTPVDVTQADLEAAKAPIWCTEDHLEELGKADRAMARLRLARWIQWQLAQHDLGKEDRKVART